MKTNNDTTLINYTFQRVAALCGLRLAYYITAATLAIEFISMSVTKYRTPSPLYILLVLAVLPSLLQTMLFSSQKQKNAKRENPLPFPLFCKKYRYDANSHKAVNLAYFLLFLLFAAWHISYALSTGFPLLIRILPTATAFLSLVTRLLGTLLYRLYFLLFPFKAMR